MKKAVLTEVSNNKVMDEIEALRKEHEEVEAKLKRLHQKTDVKTVFTDVSNNNVMDEMEALMKEHAEVKAEF